MALNLQAFLKMTNLLNLSLWFVQKLKRQDRLHFLIVYSLRHIAQLMPIKTKVIKLEIDIPYQKPCPINPGKSNTLKYCIK